MNVWLVQLLPVVICKAYQAEYGIHILVVAPQEYVNIYSTHRILTLAFTQYCHYQYCMVHIAIKGVGGKQSIAQ